MSETTDIVYRLRNGAAVKKVLPDGGVVINLALLDEAADEIEQLRMARDAANDRVAMLQKEVCL
jgi:hypothetical protein